jgi:aromatic-L-amino-acid decarboxylase
VTRPLSLGEDRERALRHAADLVAGAWRDFDSAREQETDLGPDLRELFNQPLPESGIDALAGLDEAAAALDASIAQARPRYFAYIGSSALEIGALADLLAHSFDVNLALDSKGATLIEEQALRWLGEFVGFPVGAGNFTSGGQLSNMTALAAARERAIPGSRIHGIGGARARVYGSAEAHYSNTRAVEVLGIGAANMVSIPQDDRRRVDPSALARAMDADLAAGFTPVAVIASAGTTLTGTVDPIDAIVDIAAERGVWVHVDGAYGLPASGVPARRDLFAGVERADSIAVDAHKWLYVPKACSAVLVRDAQTLPATFGHVEAYMPHDSDARPNMVDTTLEYSRPFRALKLWLAFRVHGAHGIREALQQNLAHANTLYSIARGHPSFEVLPFPPSLSIIPVRHALPGCPDINAHNDALYRAMQADGRVFISPGIIDGATWLRPCFTNFRTTDDDVAALVDVADEIGTRICPEHVSR